MAKQPRTSTLGKELIDRLSAKATIIGSLDYAFDAAPELKESGFYRRHRESVMDFSLEVAKIRSTHSAAAVWYLRKVIHKHYDLGWEVGKADLYNGTLR
jgi:hypothetical protein